jgi:hypothetical protein
MASPAHYYRGACVDTGAGAFPQEDDHMNAEAENAQQDLAFLKALVNEGPKAQATAGQVFMVAGVCYGLQCVFYWLQITFSLVWPPLMFLLVGFGPVVIFTAFIVWMLWRGRKDSQHGVATRAMNAAFGGAGLANLAMCLVFGYVSSSEKNFLIWLLYPPVTAALQGACWYVAYMIRKRLWLGAVSAGWFLTAMALGFLIRDIANYLLLLGLALFVLMVAPGYAMTRQEGDHRGH